MPKPKKRRGKIKFRQFAKIIEKNDATKVAKRDTIPQMPTKRVIPDNGATFKIKIRKK